MGTAQTEDMLSGGFSTLDEKGRISLSKPVRNALGIQAGSSLAYIMLDHALLLIPQDEHLATLMQRGADALAAAGLTADDLIAELPAARAEVVAEAYSAEFLRELEQLRVAMQDRTGDE